MRRRQFSWAHLSQTRTPRKCACHAFGSGRTEHHPCVVLFPHAKASGRMDEDGSQGRSALHRGTRLGWTETDMTDSTERAVLAGGCFWGMQDLLRRYPGVVSTR